MPQQLYVISDKTGALEPVFGSDNRENVSSRQDGRPYYNSRDESEFFTLSWDDGSSAAGDFIVYWKNTDATGRSLIISLVDLNSDANASFKLHTVTGTAVGASITPHCSNRVSPKSAQAIAVEAAGTAITGLTSSGMVRHKSVTADQSGEIGTQDTLRIGQDGAIAIEYEQGAGGRTWGTIEGFYE